MTAQCSCCRSGSAWTPPRRWRATGVKGTSGNDVGPRSSASGATHQQFLGNAAEIRLAYTIHMSQPAAQPLAGYRVAVTSARRADELCTLLRRHGATVGHAAAITMIALPDDNELHLNTRSLIANPPDIVIATTGIGFRGWIAAADGWGLAEQLTAVLSRARIVVRGPKATGAIRAAGLREEWSPESESSREVLQYLYQFGLTGCRIAVQLHGATEDWDPFPEFLDELCSAGAEVVPIRTYRWQPAPAGGEFDQLITQIAQRQFDAVSFTSAPAVAATLMRAGELGISERLLAALRSDVRAMCVGPITAQPLVRLGVPTSSPQRMRLGALARHIAEELPVLRTMQAAGHVSRSAAAARWPTAPSTRCRRPRWRYCGRWRSVRSGDRPQRAAAGSARQQL